MSNLVPAKYRVSAMAKSYRPGSNPPAGQSDYTFEIHAGEERAGVDVVLLTGGVEVTGSVADLTGGPIPRALVRTESNAFAGPATETDEGGHFSVWVSEGDVYVEAEADGYADGYERGVAPGTFQILLTPASSIAGTVVDSTTNEPVGGVPVDVATDLRTASFGSPADITDDHGRFLLDRLKPERYYVIAREPRRVGSSESSTMVGLGQHADNVVVKLYPAMRVEGKVLIAGSPPTPCKEASMSLSLPGRNDSLYSERSPDGTVYVDRALPGTYEVHVRCKGFVSPNKFPAIEVKDRDLVGLSWEVVPGGIIRGRVLDQSGTPVEGAHVRSWDADDSTTGHDGRYELGAVAPGKHTLIVHSKHGVPPPNGWEVDVAERAVVEKDLVLEQTGSISGTVVDAQGKPVVGADVSIQPLANWDAEIWLDVHRDQVESRNDGRFTLDKLPTGEYRVSVSRGGSSRDEPKEQVVAVRAPQATTVRLVVESPSSGKIRGIVSDAGGNPITDAYVVAARESDAGGSSNIEATRWSTDANAVLTGLDGSFTISALRSGKYTVRAFRKGGGEGFAEHVAIGGSAKLQIRPTGTIEGTIRVQGNVPAEVFVDVFNTTTRLARAERFFRTDGRYTMQDLPAGHYTVTAHSQQDRAQASVDLADGERKVGVDIDFGGGVSVTGRVMDLATKQPVARVRVTANLGDESYASGESFGDRDMGVLTDEAGRFRIAHVPAGHVKVTAWASRDGGYGTTAMIREVDAVHDVDVGDLGTVKRRVGNDERKGKLGIVWVEYPEETPSDQRSFQVAAIDATGPAATTDLRVGDVVIAVDGISALGGNRSSAWWLMDAPPGTPIRFGLARGTSVTVVLAAP